MEEDTDPTERIVLDVIERRGLQDLDGRWPTTRKFNKEHGTNIPERSGRTLYDLLDYSLSLSSDSIRHSIERYDSHYIIYGPETLEQACMGISTPLTRFLRYCIVTAYEFDGPFEASLPLNIASTGGDLNLVPLYKMYEQERLYPCFLYFPQYPDREHLVYLVEKEAQICLGDPVAYGWITRQPTGMEEFERFSQRIVPDMPVELSQFGPNMQLVLTCVMLVRLKNTCASSLEYRGKFMSLLGTYTGTGDRDEMCTILFNRITSACTSWKTSIFQEEYREWYEFFRGSIVYAEELLGFDFASAFKDKLEDPNSLEYLCIRLLFRHIGGGVYALEL